MTADRTPAVLALALRHLDPANLSVAHARITLRGLLNELDPNGTERKRQWVDAEMDAENRQRSMDRSNEMSRKVQRVTVLLREVSAVLRSGPQSAEVIDLTERIEEELKRR